MSEAYPYGEGQKLERLEYRKPDNQELGMYIDMVSDELESFFLCAPPSQEIDNTFEKTEEKLSRSIDFVYVKPEIPSAFNLTSMFTAGNEPTIVPTLSRVGIAYEQYREGIICEEYIVHIDRTDMGTNESFINQYHFSHYSGNHWQASVTHNDIRRDTLNVRRGVDNGKYYSRDMTPYDFDEFFKDTAEINTHLRMRLVQ